MGKRKNTKSRRVLNAADWAVILLCCAGAFLSFWFFWTDLNRAINRNQAPVGTITFKHRAAQRRFADRVLWDRLRQDSPIYEGDFIHTAELSDATVTFHEGQKISLSENSLVQIRTQGGRTVVDLASGNISLENAGQAAMVLVSGNKEVELSGVIKARSSENGGFELQVLEGSAAVHSGDDVIVQEAGQVLSISGEGAVAEPPRVIMLRPLPDERFISSGEALEISFSWTPVNFTGAEHTRLEIAGDRRFTHPLRTLDLNDSGAVVELPPGTYWWRAYVLYPEDSSPEKLTIVPAEPAPQVLSLPAPVPVTLVETPQVPQKTVPQRTPEKKTPEKKTPSPLPVAAERLPEDNHVIGADYLRRSRSLEFRWKDVAGANGYIFTLQDASGRQILQAGPLEETSYTLDLRDIDQGSFVWQVEAVRRRGNIIEQRGIPAENRFTLNIPRPGNPRVRSPGTLYGIGP
jgi:hypothetical protein